MPLTVPAPAESVTVTDAQMIAALESEGYTVTKASVVTFTASVTGPGVATAAWSGFSPTSFARNGTASGFGPWNSGPLTGEPTSGTFAFTELDAGSTYILSATYGTGQTITATVTMPAATPTPLAVAAITAQSATVGTAFSLTPAVSGGTKPYAFSTAAALPAGLTINATTGVISGTPTTAATTSITVDVHDASSPVETASATFSLTVSAVVTGGTAGFKQPIMAVPKGPGLKGAYSQTKGTGPGQMFWQDTFQTGELNPAYWRNTWGDVVQWSNDPGFTKGSATVAPASAGGGLTCDGTTGGTSSCVVTCEPVGAGQTNLVTFPADGWYIQIRVKMSDVTTGWVPAFWFPRGGNISTGVETGCEMDWFEGGSIAENTLGNDESHHDYNGDQQSAFGPFRTADHKWPFSFGGATSGTDAVPFAIFGMEWRPLEGILNYYGQSSPSMNYPDVLIGEGPAQNPSLGNGNPSDTSITSTFANIPLPTGAYTVSGEVALPGAATLANPNYVFGVTPQGPGKMYIAEVQAYILP